MNVGRRMRTTSHYVCVLAVATFAATKATAQSTPPATPPNVVMFLIDTLRADHLGAYGYDKPTSPNFDALVKESVFFENAISAEGWTLPSVPSIFTSTFPCEHNLIIDRTQLSEALETLPQRLQRGGYFTTSYYANPYLGVVTGLSRGFDFARRVPYADGETVQAWLKERPDKPYFLYIHNLEPHDPWKSPPRYAKKFGSATPAEARRISRLIVKYKSLMRADWEGERGAGVTDNTKQQDLYLSQLHKMLDAHIALYDGAVNQADERLGSVIETLKTTGQWDRTLFIVLADHGEEFNDHGAYIHGQSVYQELIHVPLLVKLPAGQYAGKRVSDPVGLVDLMPTIMEIISKPELANGARGGSLMPFIRGERQRAADEIVVTSVRINVKKFYKPWADTRGNINVAMRMGDWKGIWNKDHDTVELYDLAKDPHELHNLAAKETNLAARMREVATKFFTDCAANQKPAKPVEMSESERHELEALGYIGGKSDPEPEEEETSPASKPAKKDGGD